MTRIVKSFQPVEVKVLDAAQGLVEAVMSVTGNVDRQKDRIAPGAFGKAFGLATEKGRLPTIVFAHNWEDINQVLGSAKGWEELAPGDPGLPVKLAEKGYGGLKVQAQMNLSVPAGQIAFSHLSQSHLSEWSFAFDPGATTYDSQGVREIKSIEEIMELSLVIIGANQDTATMGTKSMEPDEGRPERTASRLGQASEIGASFKAALEAPATEKSTVPDGEPQPTEKADGAPLLTDDEAVHNDALLTALNAVNALILQEIGEGGYGEYGDIIRLCCIGQDLIRWAAGEQSEYGSFAGGLSVWDLMSAGHEALTKAEEVEPEQAPVADPEPIVEPEQPAVPAPLPAHVLASIGAGVAAAVIDHETGRTSPQHPVPDTSGEPDGLIAWTRHRVRSRA
jgi:HK97 family phage prohead protease